MKKRRATKSKWDGEYSHAFHICDCNAKHYAKQRVFNMIGPRMDHDWTCGYCGAAYVVEEGIIYQTAMSTVGGHVDDDVEIQTEDFHPAAQDAERHEIAFAFGVEFMSHDSDDGHQWSIGDIVSNYIDGDHKVSTEFRAAVLLEFRAEINKRLRDPESSEDYM